MTKLDSNNGNVYKTAKEESITRTALIGWIKKRALIDAAHESKEVNTRKAQRLAPSDEAKMTRGKFCQLEKAG